MASTLMSCMDPEDSMEKENAYLQAPGSVVCNDIAGDELTMMDESGGVLLVFEWSGAE